jgi:RIO-like serine/threonine protein kinase
VDNVVFKTCDIVKDHEKAIELEKEVAIYQTLESLQGVAIPRFIQYVNIWGLLNAIELENGGVQPKVEELYKYREQLIYKLNLIHSLGVLHNDIKVGNIVIKDDEALFLDFSNSIVCADPHLFEQEKRELLLLLQ